MGTGSSTGQGRDTTYGTRDARRYSAETSYWTELAGTKLAESSGTGRNPYIIYILYFLANKIVVVVVDTKNVLYHGVNPETETTSNSRLHYTKQSCSSCSAVQYYVYVVRVSCWPRIESQSESQLRKSHNVQEHDALT